MLDSNKLLSPESRPGPSQPWRDVPVAAADAFEAVLPQATGAILAAIAREVPEYARPFEGAFGRGIRVGVSEALRRFVALIRDPDAGRGTSREVYVGLGRGESRQGRSLDSLQAAYRVGARVAWRHAADAGLAAGLDAETMSRLAEAVFAYIDELASDSVEGYAAEQSQREGELDRRRERLIGLLLAEPASDAETVRAGAEEAAWPLPDRLAVLACSVDDLARIARGFPGKPLRAEFEGQGCALIADPDGPGQRDQIVRAVGDRTAALGPTVSPEAAARSWREARAGLAAATADVLPVNELLVVEDHLAELVLYDGRERLRRIAERRLAPLDSETPRSLERLTETLAAFLRHQAEISTIAAELHVHPQTVRYRVNRLRQLLGSQLDDPDARFEIEAALRAG